MQEVVVDVFKQFGPVGLTVVLLGFWSMYSVKWIRDLQDRFILAIDTQRKENHEALKQVVTEFKNMHGELGDKVDRLADEVRNLK